MKWCNGSPLRHAILTARLQALIRVVLTGKAMISIRAGSSCDHSLYGACASVVDCVGIGLHVDFLHCVRIGREVDNSRTDAAGDIESVNDVKIAICASSVSAGVYPVFRIEVGCCAGA